MKDKICISQSDGSKMFDCPVCEMTHSFDDRWQWNGSKTKPTFSPSLLVRYPHKGVKEVCHSFVRDGKIQFLNDCTHSLAGKTVEIPEWDGIKIKE